MNKKIDIPAIHDDDLKKVLSELGLLEKFDQGQLHCVHCTKVMNWDNLYALKVVDKNVVMFCDSPECIENSNS